MIFKYLFQLYVYVANYICPSILKKNFISVNSKNNYNYDYDYENNNFNVFEPIHETDFENDDQEDENHSLIIDVNNPGYYYSTNFTSIDRPNKQKSIFTPIIRSQSMKIPRYSCGYCNNRIYTPTHLYSDNVFCNTTCRDRQIKLDNSNKTRMIHSYSL